MKLSLKPAIRAVAETLRSLFVYAREKLHDAVYSYAHFTGLILRTAHIGPTSLSGTIFAVSATVPATFDQAGFTASGIDYVTITNVKSFPRIGAKRATSTWTPINGDSTDIVGAPTFGSGDMVFADVPADAGVVIMKAAEVGTSGQPFNLAMKITFPDSEIMYLWLKVSSFEYSFGDHSAVKEITCTVSVQKRPVVVAAV